MARRRFTLRTSHLLMWSSPLLLLVLVFTLNSRPLHATTTTTTTTTTATTTTLRPLRTSTSTTAHTPTSTGLAIAPHTPATSSTAPTPTSTSTITTTPTTSSPVVATTSVPRAHSSVSTTTSVVASVSAENRTGVLTLDSPEAVFPLRGPGQWSVVADHAVTTELICGSQSRDVVGTVRVAATQTCQLAITIATGAPTSWILRAVR